MLGRYSSIKILFNQIYPHDCVVCGTRPQLGSESSRGSRVACWGAPRLHDDLVHCDSGHEALPQAGDKVNDSHAFVR